MKTLLLAAALASAMTASAFAQDYSIPPRDPPFAKGNPGNDTFNLPNQTDLGSWGTAYGSSYNSMAYGEAPRGTRSRRAPITRTP
jgi:hypothetical protein